MKRYYRNWYQHYLELEAEKNREIQRGYYSNLVQHKGEDERVAAAVVPSGIPIDELEPVVAKKQKTKRRFRLLDLFFPLLTICTFVFVWYKLDLGPVRLFVNEALVLVGIREEATEDTIDVISYHVNLLDQHVVFAEAVAKFISGGHELSFADLDVLYDEIRLRHGEVIEVSLNVHDEAVRLWGFKVASAQQMMNNLLINEDVAMAFVQFLSDQAEIATLIRAELQILE